MRKRIFALFLCLAAACGGSSNLPPQMDAGAPDLAHERTPADLSSPFQDLSMELADLSLAPPPDLTRVCDGSCMPATTCDSGQVMASGVCRVIQTQAQCDAAHQQFVAVGLVGYCGDCVSPYQEFYGHCALPTCGSSDGTLGALCALLGRGCATNGPGGAAVCQPCDAGATLDSATQACVKTSCSVRSDCPEIAGFYCTQLKTGDAPQCRKRPCPTGQSWDRTSAGSGPTSQACTQCALCNGAEWPVTDAQGNCYCSASPGWFYDHSTSARSLKQCDEDGDGWLKESVKEELKHATANPAQLDYTVLANVQCTIPYFTSVELRNEWHQSLPLSLGDIGQAPSVHGIAMYEDPANDTAGFITASVDTSNAMKGSSVNSLTKACSTNDLDLNRNGVQDVREDQSTASTSLLPWALDYQPLTHFIELYHAHFEQASTGDTVALCDGCTPLPLHGIAGKLVIEERRRCDSDFPLLVGAAGGDYWQSCTRRRPESYASTSRLSFDFAGYDCLGGVAPSPAPTSGACDYHWPDGTTHDAPPPAISGPTYDGTVPVHGVCDSGVPATPWMGMTAYSQFMCAEVLDGNPQFNNDVPSSQVHTATQTSATWEAYTCQLNAQAATAGGPGTTATFSCPESPNGASRPVTWLARLYKNYSSEHAYSGGCVDEGVEYPSLCQGSLSESDGGAYGQIECGPPCPPSETLTDGAGAVAMCLRPTLAALPDGTPFATHPSPAPWKLQGEISLGGISGVASGCPSDGTPCWQLQ